MATRDRTEFASRVIAAREYAGMTQHELGAAAGIKQSTIAEMEVSGQSSLKTPQIARACGVDAYWLATGEGPMVAAPAPKKEGGRSHQLEEALAALVAALQEADKDKLIAVRGWLSAMAADPSTAKNKSDLILKLLVTDADKPVAPGQDWGSQPHIVGQLGVTTLGDDDGRRDTNASAKAKKK